MPAATAGPPSSAAPTVAPAPSSLRCAPSHDCGLSSSASSLEPPGRVRDLAQLFADLLEVALGRLQSGAHQKMAIVVAGHALHHPQAARVGLALVVERAERGGMDPLDVPQMEELVRDQLEEL